MSIETPVIRQSHFKHQRTSIFGDHRLYKKGCKAVQRHLAEAEVTTIGLGQVIDVCRVRRPWPPHWQVYSPDRAGVFPDKKREEVRGTLSKQRILCGSCA